MLFLKIMIVFCLLFCLWKRRKSWKIPWHTVRASIRFPFPSTGSTVKSGHGTFPLPQLCVYLSQPLSVLQDLTWEDTHMPSNCLPDGAAFSPAPHVLIFCTCGRLCPLIPLLFLFALSIHAFFSLHIHVSIHPWIHTAQTTHPPLPKPLSAPAASLSTGADSHWAMLSSVMTVSSGAAPLLCLYGETACIKIFFWPITCCTNRLLG